MYNVIQVSTLGKTWILDIDGTLVKHNGYLIDGHDTLLAGIETFLTQIKPQDMVILLSSRDESYKKQTESFLKAHHIRYDIVIYNAPYGERILVNDAKPSGMKTAIAVNTKRDESTQITFEINEEI